MRKKFNITGSCINRNTRGLSPCVMNRLLKDIKRFINENDQIHYCIRSFELMNVMNRDNAIRLVLMAAVLLVNGVAKAQSGVTVGGSVYGGGNNGLVSGSTEVNIEE